MNLDLALGAVPALYLFIFLLPTVKTQWLPELSEVAVVMSPVNVRPRILCVNKSLENIQKSSKISSRNYNCTGAACYGPQCTQCT
jgi:hypothetical protein